jgi:hypothetical protein
LLTRIDLRFNGINLVGMWEKSTADQAARLAIAPSRLPPADWKGKDLDLAHTGRIDDSSSMRFARSGWIRQQYAGGNVMTTRLTFTAAAALLVGGFMCGLMCNRPSSAQSSAQQASSPPSEQMQGGGRAPETDLEPLGSPQAGPGSQTPQAPKDGAYHVIGSGTLSYVVVMKTGTGECWALYPAETDNDERWVYLGAPPPHN